MKLLPMDKEKEVRELLTKGMTDDGIASETGVCRTTVITIRQACVSVEAMSLALKEAARIMLKADCTPGEIGSQLCVPSSVIVALKRYDKICAPRTYSVKVCPECGSSVFEGVNKALLSSRKRPYDFDPFCGMPKHEAVKFMRICNDLLQLHDLQLITSPLFRDLARRAERIFKENHEKSK